jgi:rhodanese-related sulfurtransferase
MKSSFFPLAALIGDYCPNRAEFSMRPSWKMSNCVKRTVVFRCGSGIRSAKAAAACQKAGLAHDSRLEGGIQAWKTAGYPTVAD